MGLFSKKDKDSQIELSQSGIPTFQTLLEEPPEPPPPLDLNQVGMPQKPVFLPPEPPSFMGKGSVNEGLAQPFSQQGALPLPPVQLMPLPQEQSSFAMDIPASDSKSIFIPKAGAPAPPKFSPMEAEQQIGVQQITDDEADEFELPDFDDAEFKEIEDKFKETEDLPDVKVTGWSAEPGDKYEVKAEKVLPPRKPEELVPMPEQIVLPVILANEKFLELMDFFRLKEDLLDARTNSRDTEEQMLAETYKMRLEKCNALSTSLNAIQDRLMLIDGKLFEKPEVNE
jgi:hypothetical protein